MLSLGNRRRGRAEGSVVAIENAKRKKKMGRQGTQRGSGCASTGPCVCVLPFCFSGFKGRKNNAYIGDQGGKGGRIILRQRGEKKGTKGKNERGKWSRSLCLLKRFLLGEA